MSQSSDEVGSLAEEAAKLFGAISGFARDHEINLAEGLADPPDRATAAPHGADGHPAAGGAECTSCPVCRAITLFRSTSPEVRAHLADAASSLVQAAAGMMATHVPHPDHPEAGPEAGPEEKADENRSRDRARPPSPQGP